MSRIFMDGGSNINIIFSKTLREISVPSSALKTSHTTFYEGVPRKAIVQLRKINLDVVFGDRENFMKENLDLEVVGWPSQCHAILSRPAFARFLAIPYYAYLKLQMPGPAGVITIS